MTPPQVMLRAAQLLTSDAEEIKATHTLKDKWVILDPADETAKADHDERMSIAAKLELLAMHE